MRPRTSAGPFVYISLHTCQVVSSKIPWTHHISYSLAPAFSKVEDRQSCCNVGLSELS